MTCMGPPTPQAAPTPPMPRPGRQPLTPTPSVEVRAAWPASPLRLPTCQPHVPQPPAPAPSTEVYFNCRTERRRIQLTLRQRKVRRGGEGVRRGERKQGCVSSSQGPACSRDPYRVLPTRPSTRQAAPTRPAGAGEGSSAESLALGSGSLQRPWLASPELESSSSQGQGGQRAGPDLSYWEQPWRPLPWPVGRQTSTQTQRGLGPLCRQPWHHPPPSCS